MKKRYATYLSSLSVILLLVSLLLVACGSTGNAATPSSSNSAKQSNTTVTSYTSASAASRSSNVITKDISNNQGTSTGTGKDYAFVRNNQVWVALNGGKPVQATHLTGQTPPYTWSNLLWFAHDRYIAFTVEKSARGGNICPALPLLGQIFVLDTRTMQTTTITTSGPTTSQQIPLDGSWSTLTAQDDTHLLAWLDGRSMYQYDFTTQTMSLLISRSALPAFQGSVFSQAVRNGRLYYGIISRPDASEKSHLAIYSRPLSGGSASNTLVFDAGSETICSFTQQNGLITNLSWDISPDSTHLVTVAIDATNAQGTVKLVNLKNGNTTTPIFTQVPANEGVNSGAIMLSWSPDNQHILLESYKTLYTSSVSSPSSTQTYQTQYPQHVSWNTAGSAFATDNIRTKSVQMYTIGTSNGQVLLTNASDFAWGIR